MQDLIIHKNSPATDRLIERLMDRLRNSYTEIILLQALDEATNNKHCIEIVGNVVWQLIKVGFSYRLTAALRRVADTAVYFVNRVFTRSSKRPANAQQ